MKEGRPHERRPCLPDRPEPGVALGHVTAVMEREDIRRYRIPCARCGQGSVGVDRVEDE